MLRLACVAIVSLASPDPAGAQDEAHHPTRHTNWIVSVALGGGGSETTVPDGVPPIHFPYEPTEANLKDVVCTRWLVGHRVAQSTFAGVEIGGRNAGEHGFWSSSSPLRITTFGAWVRYSILGTGANVRAGAAYARGT